MSNKKWVLTICTIVLISIIVYGLYEWLVNNKVRPDAFLLGGLVLAWFFFALGNGNHRWHDQDEREEYLSKKAAEISYWGLVIILGIILFATNDTVLLENLDNLPLVIGLSISIFLFPLVRAYLFKKHQ